MQAKKELAYRKLVGFYIGLSVVTGVGSIVMAISPSLPACSHAGSGGGAPVAYLCSADGATYILQVMAYALALSLGCLALVVAMHRAAERQR
jgi:hypothetical protein